MEGMLAGPLTPSWMLHHLSNVSPETPLPESQLQHLPEERDQAWTVVAWGQSPSGVTLHTGPGHPSSFLCLYKAQGYLLPR